MRTSASMPKQAAEKAIKAVYRTYKREFRYTHDLAELLNGLMAAGIEVPHEVRDAVELTGFAWEARYPGTGEPASEEEYKRAVALAERVVHWAEARVKGKPQ
jgi:HEPN domain-containing protein